MFFKKEFPWYHKSARRAMVVLNKKTNSSLSRPTKKTLLAEGLLSVRKNY
jgi:hypothetical protein